MSRYYYKKTNKKNARKIYRFLSLAIFLSGILLVFYIFSPLILWQIYVSPVFASYDLAYPIPKTSILSSLSIKTLFSEANPIAKTDYTNAQNWFPNFKPQQGSPRIPFYNLSIPKLGIQNATISTTDNFLERHLVNYKGTAIPPDKGNAVVFGHSTLPQLFNPNDYKTIFATLHTIKIGDMVYVESENVVYEYKIFNIIIIDPSDTSIFTQAYDNSYLTLVTCTPPGTTWKRLIVKARLEKI